MTTRLDLTPLVDLADDELVASYREGNVAALETLLERYRRFARAEGRSYFHGGADSADNAQEGPPRPPPPPGRPPPPPPTRSARAPPPPPGRRAAATSSSAPTATTSSRRA